jgi:hypothetical protein
MERALKPSTILYQNRTVLSPNSSYSDRRNFLADAKGTITMTYATCPEVETCRGKTEVNVSFAIETPVSSAYRTRAEKAESQIIWYQAGLAIAAAAVVVLVYAATRTGSPDASEFDTGVTPTGYSLDSARRG